MTFEEFSLGKIRYFLSVVIHGKIQIFCCFFYKISQPSYINILSANMLWTASNIRSFKGVLHVDQITRNANNRRQCKTFSVLSFQVVTQSISAYVYHCTS